MNEKSIGIKSKIHTNKILNALTTKNQDTTIWLPGFKGTVIYQKFSENLEI